MPDTDPETISPPKSELPTKFEVVVYRRCAHDAAFCESIAAVRIREDGHLTVLGSAEEVANAYTPLLDAASKVGRTLARAAMKGAFDEAMVAPLTEQPTATTDPVVRRIDEIQTAASDTLAPETITLLALAKEAQTTGQMPDLSKLNQPTDLPCCQ